MIHFTCGRCRAAFNVKDDKAGQAAKCRKCGGGLRIPSPAAPPIIARQVRTRSPFPMMGAFVVLALGLMVLVGLGAYAVGRYSQSPEGTRTVETYPEKRQEAHAPEKETEATGTKSPPPKDNSDVPKPAKGNAADKEFAPSAKPDTPIKGEATAPDHPAKDTAPPKPPNENARPTPVDPPLPLNPATPTEPPMSPDKPAYEALDAAVRFTLGQDTYTASAPQEKKKHNLWLNGPLCTEERYITTPKTASGEAHPLLRVIFDVRSYKDGARRIDVCVENCLDVAAGLPTNYAVQILLDGKVAFDHPAFQHYYLTRWRKTFFSGGKLAQAIPDFAPHYATGALPIYLSLKAKAYPASPYSIMGAGPLSADMSSTGGRMELAPYPEWAARMLSNPKADVVDYTIGMGDVSASWPVHLCNTDGTSVTIDQKPTAWWDNRGVKQGPGGLLGHIDAPQHLQADVAHQPSLAYIPYLLTGDRFYADEMAAWGNYSLFVNQPDGGHRNGAKGLLSMHSVQVRGMAWSMRNIADAAAYLPDADPIKVYLKEKLANNLLWADAYADKHVNPLGTVLEVVPDSNKSIWAYETWQCNYLAWALSHANRQGFSGGTKLRDRIVAFQTKLFTSEPDYPRAYALASYVAVAKTDAQGGFAPFASMEAVYDYNFKAPGVKTPPHPIPSDPYIWDARLSLMEAAGAEVPGAQAQLDWLTPQLTQANMESWPGWAIAPDAPAAVSPAVKVTLTPGWATFGQVFPQASLKDKAQIGDLDTQTDVKTHWPDGSIRFAVLTASVPKAAVYEITQAK